MYRKTFCLARAKKSSNCEIAVTISQIKLLKLSLLKLCCSNYSAQILRLITFRAGSERRIQNAEWHQTRVPKILLPHNFSKLPFKEGTPKKTSQRRGTPQVRLGLILCCYLISYQIRPHFISNLAFPKWPIQRSTHYF